MEIMIKMSDVILKIPGIGEKQAKHLGRLGISNVEQLLYHFPVAYEDRRKISQVSSLVAGSHVALEVGVDMIQSRRSHRKKMILCEALCSDESGTIRVVWFGNRFVAKQLQQGDKIFLYGKVYQDAVGLQLRSPEYEKVKAESIHVKSVVPRYALTRGITQKQLRFYVHRALEHVEIDEWLPDVALQRQTLMSMADALRAIHFPVNGKQLRLAQKRLKFDELFLLRARSVLTQDLLRSQKAYVIARDDAVLKQFVSSLPFTLTDDQKKAVWEILLDMRREYPMNRLLQGDVGSGKTVVAVMALYACVSAGKCGMLMVPTDILAQQHFASVKKLLGEFDITIGLFTRTARIINDDEVTKKVFSKRAEEVDIFIGTHALLFENLGIEDLGLVVVDEQHRFGVLQRAAIKDRTNSDIMPHFLSMTATPIPRSAGLVLYGELDVSIIREKPANRKVIKTKLVSDAGRAKAYAFVQNQIDRDRQVFVVCPMIEESDELDVANVEAVFDRLSKDVFSARRVEKLHGKMKQKEKDVIMKRMVDGEIDVLVSTSVIEVGVDVPNATVMMIEGAERFGLAQLHQFRGRIGRASHQSYCLVFPTRKDVGAIGRLRIFEQEHDGFVLAQHDLQMRGPGDLYGTVQSGFPDLRLANLKDTEIIQMVQFEVERLFVEDKEKRVYKNLWEKIDAMVREVHLE